MLASGPLPLFDQVIARLSATPVQERPDYHMGLNMPHLYQRAGLPLPQLTLEAPLGTGSDWAGHQYLTDTVGMLEKPMQQRGTGLPAEIGTPDLADRTRHEAVRTMRSSFYLPSSAREAGSRRD